MALSFVYDMLEQALSIISLLFKNIFLKGSSQAIDNFLTNGKPEFCLRGSGAKVSFTDVDIINIVLNINKKTDQI